MFYDSMTDTKNSMSHYDYATMVDTKLLLEGWTLQDRINIIRDRKSNRCRPEQQECSYVDIKLWETSVGGSSKENFQKRLVWDGLTIDDVAWIINPPDKDIPKHPDWWDLLQLIRFKANTFNDSGILDDRCNNRPFVHAWRSVAAWALQELRKDFIDQSYYSKISESAWIDFGQALLDKLCVTSDQALWALFNERRSPDQILMAYFNNKDSQRNGAAHVIYDQFIVELKESNYNILLDTYPVMGRLLSLIVMHWQNNCRELLQRLIECWPMLSKNFVFPMSASLDAVQLDVSDPHNEGRTVAILRFGAILNGKKIVYKPKCLKLDLAYNKVLEVLNQESVLPKLKMVAVLSLDGYGFVDYIEHRLSNDISELRSFYKNTGRIIAILHLLGCTDCHYENLIAIGDQPLVIDLETLFEVDLCKSNENSDGSCESIQSIIDRSVLRLGLLPKWILFSGLFKGRYDISALGIQSPSKGLLFPCWVGLNSDGMMPGTSAKNIEVPTCLPFADENDHHHTDFTKEICSGFLEQIGEILRIRLRLIETIKVFMNIDRRIVFRGTRRYCDIIQEMLEPKSLKLSTTQGFVVEQINKNWVLIDQPSSLWTLHDAELCQLYQLNIPYFSHPIDRDLLVPMQGMEAINCWIKRTGLVSALERLKLLNSSEMQFQATLIRGSLEARRLDHLNDNLKLFSVCGEQITQEKIISLNDFAESTKFGLDVCEELWDEAIINKDGCPEWLGIEPRGNFMSYQFGLLGSSIYSGKIGIALAMAKLSLVYSKTNLNLSTLWRNRASACIEHLDAENKGYTTSVFPRMSDKQPLGMLGLGGILLGLYLLQEANVDNAAYLSNKLISSMRRDLIMEDTCLDILEGVAGLIGPLLLAGTSRSLDLAFSCGERLLALQQENGSWARNGDQVSADISQLLGPYPKITSARRRSLGSSTTGFCSGTSGIGAALGRLAHSTSYLPFEDAARKALLYEREEKIKIEKVCNSFYTNTIEKCELPLWGEGLSGIILSRFVLQAASLNDDAFILDVDNARDEIYNLFMRIDKTHEFDNSFAYGRLGLYCLLNLQPKANHESMQATKIDDDCAKTKKEHLAGYQNLTSIKYSMPDQLGLFTGKSGLALWMLEQPCNLNWIQLLLTAGLLW
jgi:type 2 lantibiotic biosynthesis protein LanM